MGQFFSTCVCSAIPMAISCFLPMSSSPFESAQGLGGLGGAAFAARRASDHFERPAPRGGLGGWFRRIIGRKRRALGTRRRRHVFTVHRGLLHAFLGCIGVSRRNQLVTVGAMRRLV